ncbi:MAG TPA: ABC transporter substrate-binding protein, partial [Burkholderiales bacterium]|nr:ABC transporter substrate-binding protein [Burkholderiales bacterium]
MRFALALLVFVSGAALGQANRIVAAIGTAPPDLTLQTYYFAESQGFYKQEGIDVQLTAYNGDATAMRAMTAGEADIAALGLAIPLKAIEQGARVKVVFASAPKMDYLLIAQKGVNSAKELEGKNVGISG